MVTISFTINRKPVSVNATYKKGRNSPRLFLSPEAKDYKASVAAHAFAAARSCNWPKPESVRSVDLTLVTWNTRHDADAAVKITSDSMEGIVYANDRCIRSVTSSKAKDDGLPRVDVVVTLIEVAA